jgi:hypothetical protein
MTTEWVPEARPVPVELTEEFEAEPYRDPFADTIAQRLDAAMREKLEAFKLLGGGVGDVAE